MSFLRALLRIFKGKRMARETGWGTAVEINLAESLNIDSVSADVKPFGQKGNNPHILNNGIYKDGGLTEMFVTSGSNGGAGRTTVLSNGAKVSLNGNTVSVNGRTAWTIGDANISDPGTFTRLLLNQKNYYDVVCSGDRTHFIGLYYENGWKSDRISLTGAVTNTFSLTSLALTTMPVNAAIVRNNTMAYNTIDFVYLQPDANLYYYGTVPKLIDSGRIVSKDAIISAYSNGSTKTWLVSCSNNIYQSTNPTTSWTTPYFGYGTMAEVQAVNDLQTTIKVSTYKNGAITFGHYIITIAATGAVSSAVSPNGLLVPDTPVSFTPYCITPYGASGLYTSNVATQNSEIINHTSGTKQTVAGWTRNPECFGMTLDGYIRMWSQNGINTYLSYSPNSTEMFTCMINDFGDLTYNPIIQSSVASDIYVHNVSYNITTGNSGSLVYRRNDGIFVGVNIGVSTAAIAQEIAPGVCVFNTTASKNAIIDTNTMTAYDNVSTWVPAIVSTVLTPGTNQWALGVYNKYSTSVYHSQFLASTGSIVPALPYGTLTTFPYFVYSGTALDYSYTQYNASGTTNVSPYLKGTSYVLNNLYPLSPVSTFQGGGVITLWFSGIQFPNYFGVSQNSVIGGVTVAVSGGSTGNYASIMRNFFILFGQYFSFDGTYIYQVNLSGGSTGDIQGQPQRVALANGLQFFCASPTVAVFYSPFDNSIYTFDGGRDVKKFLAFNKESILLSGVYVTRDNTLYLTHNNSEKTYGFYSIRDNIVTENAWPTANTYTAYAASDGFYAVSDSVASSYYKYSYYKDSGAVIPMVFQSAYYAAGPNQTMKVTRIAGRMYFENINANYTYNFTWNWETQDSQGTITAPVTFVQNGGTSTGNGSIVIPASGYVSFDWTPASDYVYGGSFGMARTDSVNNKVVILQLDVYYTSMDETPTLNKVQ